MVATKLYTCFEAEDHLLKHAYLIYSAEVSDLRRMTSDSKPKFILEKIIYAGVQYMGCGVHGSKIVFAGGVSDAAGTNAPKRSKYNRNLITYDPVTKHESLEDFPHMRGRKIRPLVLELSNKLYVLDTGSSAHNWSFEFHNPMGNFWDPLMNRLKDPYPSKLGRTLFGRTPYAWFVAGNVLSISMNGRDRSFFYHPKQYGNHCLLPTDQVPFPFQGMAVTYFHPEFSDVVVISFSGGSVEGRRLKFDSPYFGTPKEIFKTQPCIPDGELSSYFADCGEGVFCLTTFDNANIHFYMFKICRLPEHDFLTLNLALIGLDIHKYRFSDFSFKLNRCVSISGCFAMPSVDRAKKIEEAQLYADLFGCFEDREEEEEDVDDPIYYIVDGYAKTRINWPSDNSDSDDPETDVAGC